MAEENKKVVQNQEDDKKKKKLGAWWKGLKTPAKVAICAVAGLGVTSAVVFPVLANTVWKKTSEEGVQVSKTVWEKELKNIGKRDANSKFKCNCTASDKKSNGDDDCNYVMLVDGYNLYQKKEGKSYELYEKYNGYIIESIYKINNQYYSAEYFTKDSTQSPAVKQFQSIADNISEYDSFKFNDNTKFYEYEKSSSKGSTIVKYKFNKNEKLVEMSKTSDGETEKFNFGYENISFNVPDHKNTINVKAGSSGEIISDDFGWTPIDTVASTKQYAGVICSFNLSELVAKTGINLDNKITISITNENESLVAISWFKNNGEQFDESINKMETIPAKYLENSDKLTIVCKGQNEVSKESNLHISIKN